ncbi:MAG: type IV toxin-antitoxin system AbiEi family antitoxin [Gammaproteobacteria bacterium]|nr:type IV toxin-antitoxin system AbiEi family antitoxin [Gammaproteobacteria bacterium]MDE0256975.1 type IV toxin-antitoxin system AbiEi family antitoxin [Gammaproteobacteria bacterium]
MFARDYVADMAARGRHHFTTDEAVGAIRSPRSAVRAQLRRLKARGVIAEPIRGFNIIVPAEYRSRGCLPAEQFIPQLMDLAGEPYYFALLSAAERYGAAHQRPQVVQVMARRNRAAIECGQVRVVFVARHDLGRMFVKEFNTPRGLARYSTPEVTALELVGYPSHAGGIANVATVLRDLAEEMEADALARAAHLSPVSWSQRLGYLLERFGESDLVDTLLPFVEEQARSYTPLRRAAPNTGAGRDATWKLIVNVVIETDG